MNLPKKVRLCEVGLRDGIQNEKTILTTEQKLILAKAIIDEGFKVIELGSFMNPKAVPQTADTDELYKRLGDVEGVDLRALSANLKGVERAAACGCKKVKLNVSASRAHNIANLNMTPEESVAKFKSCCDLAGEKGIAISGSISMPFGSPWEHDIPFSDVCAIIEAYLGVGITEISLSDASGMAVPNQVFRICSDVKAKYPQVKWWLHFHNTRGVAMANIVAAMQAGITQFDSSFGGLGGCPFVPGAAGNIATEDAAHMLMEMGVETGLDTLKCIETAKLVREMVGHPSDSYLIKAGRSKDLNLELPKKQVIKK